MGVRMPARIHRERERERERAWNFGKVGTKFETLFVHTHERAHARTHSHRESGRASEKDLLQLNIYFYPILMILVFYNVLLCWDWLCDCMSQVRLNA